MHAKPGVGVLVKMGAVEKDQAVLVGRKVRRYPVQNHADAVPGEVIDEVGKILRCAIATGDREGADSLLPP